MSLRAKTLAGLGVLDFCLAAGCTAKNTDLPGKISTYLSGTDTKPAAVRLAEPSPEPLLMQAVARPEAEAEAPMEPAISGAEAANPVLHGREAARMREFPGYEDPVFSSYDTLIVQYTDFWNDAFKDVPGAEPLDPNLVKSMILEETGGHTDRDYLHDPMQIANEGDYALDVLRDGLEPLIPERGYSDLRGIDNTPKKYRTVKKKGKEVSVFAGWDHSKSEITPELSIKYGIRWLWHKNLIPATRVIEDEKSPLQTYTVEPGDTLSEIANRFGTTVSTIKKYSRMKNPDMIAVGQQIAFRKARTEAIPAGVRGWREAVARYNGGGNLNYASEVFGIYNSEHKPAEGEYYTVHRGDSLWKISKMYNTTPDGLKRLNGLNSDVIHPGQKLKYR